LKRLRKQEASKWFRGRQLVSAFEKQAETNKCGALLEIDSSLLADARGHI
jgi:hypothetical protein